VWSVLFLFLAACSSTPKGTPLEEIAPEINASLSPEAVVLGPGGTLEIQFPRQTEWNHETKIRSDGMASFLSIDDMRVGGLTVAELDHKLTAAYAKVIPSPDLTVLVKELAEQANRNVVVIGEVTRPGLVPMKTPRLTLVDAIGQAGGPQRKTAELSRLMLVRWMPDVRQQKSWKINASQENWNSKVPIFLQPYDIVYVPSTAVTKVNQWIDQYIRQMIPFPYLFPPVPY
jgi:polysaccharide export outer membrane protein